MTTVQYNTVEAQEKERERERREKGVFRAASRPVAHRRELV